MSRKVVYVCGPYSSDPVRNTRQACDVGRILWSLGFVPIVPHLSMFFDFAHPLKLEEWIEMDLCLVERCDAVYRFPGESRGADIETNHADGLGIPVFTNIEALANWAQPRYSEKPAKD